MSYDIVPGRPGEFHPAGGQGSERTEQWITGEHLADPSIGAGGFGAGGFGVGGFGAEGFGAEGFSAQGFGVQGARSRALVEQAVLRRYLLTRALGGSIRNAVRWAGFGLLVVAVVIGLAGFKVFAVLVAIVGIAVLLLQALLSGLLRKLSGAAQPGQHQPRIAALVGQTRKGLRRELRRVGLPASPWGPLLIAFRLVRSRRRADTVARLAAVDLAAVVPQSRVAELHLVMGTSR